jgi:uncharacterized protein YukE
MSINLPSQVVWFLNFIGVNWPDVDEDQVRAFAGHVKDFGNNLSSTHDAASSTIQQMSSAYSGQSYEQLVETWAQMSSSHMSELVTGCNVVSTALDVAADAIVAAKIAAIGELIGLAASFVADQAAAIVTFGAAEAAEALIVEAAKKLVNALIDQLEQHIMGEVIQAAVAPLENVVEKALGGLVFKGLEAALGAPSAGDGGGGGGGGSAIHYNTEELAGHATTMNGHAQQISAHAQTFAAAASGVSFGG